MRNKHTQVIESLGHHAKKAESDAWLITPTLIIGKKTIGIHITKHKTDKQETNRNNRSINYWSDYKL